MTDTPRSPRNTAQASPAEHLLVAASPGGIEAQEAQGQREMVHSDVLPVDAVPPRKRFEELGFVFGDKVPNDPLFVKATLPEGWSRVGTEHSMWSSIVDERGVERVAIFYKAAFYDRSAHMTIVHPGRGWFSKQIYRDDNAPLDVETFHKLNEEERTQVQDSLVNMLNSIDAHPDIYGKYMDRVREIEELLN